MVNRVLTLLNRDFSGLHQAAFLIGGATVFSQVLALVRDRLFASTFGASATLDIYFAAFRIPDFIYVFVASLVSGAILIPLIVEKNKKDGVHELRLFLNSILTFFLLLLIFVSTVVVFLMPQLADIVAPGFSGDLRQDFIDISRLLLVSPLLLGISNLFASVTQAFRRFFAYALAPVLYNFGIIFGILFFYEPFGITGLAYGVILGALLHLLIQVPVLYQTHLIPRITSTLRFAEIRHVITLSIPRTISLGSHHLLIVIFTALASFMTAGSIAVFNLSYNLQSVPLAIIGVSYSVAAFPTLSRIFSQGDPAQFVQKIVVAGRHIIFWSLPVLALFIVLRAHIVRVILGAGAFDWQDTRLTAAALALFSFSVVAQGLILLFVRGYYASGNTKKPVIVNVISFFVGLLSVYLLLNLFDASIAFRTFFENLFRVSGISGTRILMLPLAFSIFALTNLFLLWLSFKRDFRAHYISIRKSVFENIAAAIIIGLVSYLLLQVLDDTFDINTFMGIFMQGFLAGIGGLFVGILFLRFLRNQELLEFEQSMRDRFWKKKPVLPEPQDIEGH